MNLLALAARNLLRNRRRSAATLFAMTVGAVAILLFGGYSRNINLGLQTDFVQQGGHLQIQHRDYFLFGTGNPAAYGIRDYRRIIAAIKRDPVLASMVRVVTPTLSLGGIAGNYAAGVSRTVIGNGVEVDDQNRMRTWNDYDFPVRHRPLRLTGTTDDAAVIGTGVARVLQLCAPLAVKHCPLPQPVAAQGEAVPGDIAVLAQAEGSPTSAAQGVMPRIELLAANAHGAPNVARLQVAAAEAMGVKEIDDLFVQLHLGAAQRLIYGAAPPQATAIVVQLAHSAQLPAAQARLQHLLERTFPQQALTVLDFATLNPSYGQIVGMFSAIFGFIALLIGVIVLFTVGNTMSMAVVERTTEIGTLRAIGLRRAGIRRLFIAEGSLLGLAGSVLGSAAALLLAYLINHSGLTWTPPGNTEPIPLLVRVWGEHAMLLGTALGLTLVAMGSAWWPARRAARLQIVDALGHV
ncbi:FtsX-like permease family protein [Chitiniphilus purpureus]|uniref:FtsX-like permease family protein n=1 Tax=Chitiniphilus purpureus TaxID=2981137 RepID=A0ABY6DQH9_9NEIS|nr:FtsX-like permease family protein [Chitiniphilus sp. CD1]UXY16609.1 FtsX-like permease family protein [Chitiniphilus sp. CD1]